MSNDWTNKLREHLADYQEPVKDDLWAAIEQSLAQNQHANTQSKQKGTDAPLENEAVTPRKQTTPARTIALRRFSMAAAIAALAIGGTYVYLHPWEGEAPAEMASVLSNQANQDKTAKQNLANTGKSVESLYETTDDDNAKAIPAESKSSLLSALRLRSKADDAQQRTGKEAQPLLGNSQTEKTQEYSQSVATSDSKLVASSQTKAEVSSDSKLIASSDNKSESTDVQENASQKKSILLGAQKPNLQNPRKTQSNNTDYELAAANYEPLELHHSKKAEWSMQLYGENGLVVNNSNTNQPMLASSFPSSSDFPAFSNDSKLNAYGDVGSNTFDADVFKLLGNLEYTEKVKHHQPISVGMQVGYALTEKLQLTTGLVYTYTSSDFIGSANGNQVVTTQKLHYLGIPVHLSYDVWSTKGFRTYVTLGGEGAVNIKNQTETDGTETSSKRDRMQWSANAAIGAQYNFIPQLGIYVEPGAKYYFDNGSQIENTFKDKKFNFNFQLGLRWNIK